MLARESGLLVGSLIWGELTIVKPVGAFGATEAGNFWVVDVTIPFDTEKLYLLVVTMSAWGSLIFWQ
jgi:hypothetical protein